MVVASDIPDWVSLNQPYLNYYNRMKKDCISSIYNFPDFVRLHSAVIKEINIFEISIYGENVV